MKSITLILCLAMLGNTPAIAADDVVNEQGMRSLLTFISDVTTFEGMYYSVHDYCAPYTTRAVADVSRKAWLEANESLLASRDDAVDRLMKVLSQRENGKDASQKMLEWVKAILAKSRDNDRLYKDIVPMQDKLPACNARLGEMNSKSMRFDTISPGSYAFWQQHRAP